jgi:stringent starvation protein B
MDKKTPDKKERLLAVLDRGMVMIHLDARRPGVMVPEALRKEAHLRLNLSYRFDPPDLTVTEWGIRSTLSFSDVRHKVCVPWSAVFAMTSHVSKEFWMYPDDMPPELLQTPLPEKVTAAPRPVPSPVPEVSESKDQGKEASPPVASRGHLRLVK